MSDTEILMVPLTPIELARLQDACRDGLTPAGMMLFRRLAFQEDLLRQRHEAAMKVCRDLWAYRDAVQSDQATCRKLYNAWRALGDLIRGAAS